MKPSFKHLEKYRIKNAGKFNTGNGERCGAFLVPFEAGELVIIADDGQRPGEISGWEHVSVHWRNQRGMAVPIWTAMVKVKDLFWSSDECVIQYHPPKSNYVNTHPCTLHLWKQCGQEFILPPVELV